ncbi:MAG: ATP phosphoribosyltransferase regulatory subunit, partial [Polyangiales bacterium]
SKIGGAYLRGLSDSALSDVAGALSKKDAAELSRACKRAGLTASQTKPLVALTRLHGRLDVLKGAEKHLPDSSSALDELRRVGERLERSGFGDRVQIDLSELRRQAYYTGVSVTFFADGPGEPIGTGGRYDNLLSAFGKPLSATGFAFDIDNVESALVVAGNDFSNRGALRIVVGGTPATAVQNWLNALRQNGIIAIEFRGSDAERIAYAKAWNYDAVLHVSKSDTRALRCRDNRSRAMGIDELKDLAEWAKRK